MYDSSAPTDDCGKPRGAIKYADQNRAVLNEAEAADYTRVSVSSLRKGRMNGRRDNHVEPPPYLKLGRRVAYLRTDLDAWLLAHRVGV